MGRPARLAGQRLSQFSHFQPAQLGRLDIGAVAGDALGQLGEPLRISGEEVGIVQRLLVGGN